MINGVSTGESTSVSYPYCPPKAEFDPMLCFVLHELDGCIRNTTAACGNVATVAIAFF